MNIVLASSEVVPFAKSGGLGDVCGTLPKELAARGEEIIVVLPAYRSVFECGIEIETTGHELSIPIGSKAVRGRVLQAYLPGSEVRVYFIDQPEYFDRKEFYNEDGKDYPDNCERFIFFCRGVLELIQLLELDVDLIHCNDWQTGLIPAYVDIEYRKIPRFEKVATLMTIHNLAYQGWFWHWDMALTGLDWKYFNWQQMEYFDQLNLLKTGIVFADRLSTVSEKYSEEIQTPEFGCGLEGVLSDRNEQLSGILNGVDYTSWNPEIDDALPEKFSVDNWRNGKLACKVKLQAEMGLPQQPELPLIGLVGRLAEQKGWDVVIEMIRSWVVGVDAQWVILGSGDAEYQATLEEIAKKWPHKVAAHIGFDESLARRIEAGSDMFFMPSRYEPCGLNQMYSLKYGSVPIVHATGGLADTIMDATPAALEDGSANGFSFSKFDFEQIRHTMRRAIEVYCDHPDLWRQIVETGMRQDWSWQRSAEKYVELYQKTINQRLSRVAST